MKKRFIISMLLFAVLPFGSFAQQPPSPLQASFQQYQQMKQGSLFNLDWVSIGPAVNSARADVVQADPKHPATIYAGFGSGGLWKTTNNGINWDCVFHDQASLGIGDFKLAPSDPNIIYLGTGENLKKPRNFTLPGTGMYRSDDAGKTWTSIGLEDSWSIANIAIHPSNPDIVMVAVMGHLWSKNIHRGLYQTLNGGKSWQQVLYKNDSTGANDVVIATSHPETIYASLWENYPGISGKNSGVFTSNDGGKNWLACTNGLPSGPLTGRTGIAVSGTNPLKAYALVDNLNNPAGQSAELYKTIDGGLTWTKTHSQPLRIYSVIGWYFSRVYVNPLNDEEVYCLGVRLIRSTDGGKNFSVIAGKVSRANPGAASGFHLDQCSLWIDPNDPAHLLAGNDGGLYASFDQGASWFHHNNIPAGEFYDIFVDQKKKLIYGGTQDDATVFGPAREFDPRIKDPWKYIWIDPWDGGDGCVTQVDPEDDNIIYYSSQHGGVVRYNRREDTAVGIRPKLPKQIKDTLLFNYITPYFISPHNSKTLYIGGNYTFKTDDQGNNWKVISSNLTNSSDPEKRSNSTGALIESPISKGLLFAGTDKGAFWISKNDGTSWEENDKGLANNYIRSICPSRFDKSRVYTAMTGINYDDLGAYLYSSSDLGKTWTSISAGLPNEPINVVIEDPTNENILYAGSIRSVYISIDRGKSWSCLGSKMPGVAIADLEIHHSSNTLFAATHGRGIYRIDLGPIYDWISRQKSEDKDHLFEMAEAHLPWFQSYSGLPDLRTAEKAVISYWLSNAGPVTISMTDKNNREVWILKTEGKKGFNQYRWDLVVSRQNSDQPYFTRYETYLKEGVYKMKLFAGNNISEQPFILRKAVSSFREPMY
jgi:photosystem II stability/assembly factor-like uncharacterized protein